MKKSKNNYIITKSLILMLKIEISDSGTVGMSL